MYLSPFATLAYAEGHSSVAAARGAAWFVGGTIGYSRVFGRVVNLRAGAGVQYVSMEVTGEGRSFGETSTVRLGMKGVLLAVDLSLGFVF